MFWFGSATDYKAHTPLLPLFNTRIHRLCADPQEERDFKSEIFVPQALKRKLVGYDGSTIYRVQIKEQDIIIRIEDLRIFEDTTPGNANLPDYNGKPTFKGFIMDDENEGPTLAALPINDK